MATEKLADMKNMATQKLDAAKSFVSGSTEKKPTLERQMEIPSLGTPMVSPGTPGDIISIKPLVVNAPDNASLTDKAKFAVGATTDWVKDKADNLSMNADDTGPLEDVSSSSGKESILQKAKAQLDDLKSRVAEKVEDFRSSGSKSSNAEEKPADIGQQSSSQ